MWNVIWVRKYSSEKLLHEVTFPLHQVFLMLTMPMSQSVTPAEHLQKCSRLLWVQPHGPQPNFQRLFLCPAHSGEVISRPEHIVYWQAGWWLHYFTLLNNELGFGLCGCGNMQRAESRTFGASATMLTGGPWNILTFAWPMNRKPVCKQTYLWSRIIYFHKKHLICSTSEIVFTSFLV